MSTIKQDTDFDIKTFESMLDGLGKAVQKRQIPEAFLNVKRERGRPVFITVPEKTLFARISKELHTRLFDYLGKNRIDYKVWLMNKIREL